MYHVHGNFSFAQSGLNQSLCSIVPDWLRFSRAGNKISFVFRQDGRVDLSAARAGFVAVAGVSGSGKYSLCEWEVLCEL